MNPDYSLTIADIMKRPAFQHAYVAAGADSLHRTVRWVHIVEVIQFEELLQGGEMILTTGAAFKNNTHLFTNYIAQLVKRNVACLGIEMGHYISDVPAEWLGITENNGLPLIIFPKPVRFIEITQDIHAQIINQHHHDLQELERISREFHRLTLTSQGVGHVLQLLQSSTHAQVIYLPIEGQPHFVPAPSDKQARHWMELLKANAEKQADDAPSAPLLLEDDGQTLIIQPVGAMGKTWAILAIALSRKPRQHDYLILDSASLSIAQDLLRKRYMEERKLYSQTLWVDDLLHLRIRDEDQIKAFVGTAFKKLNQLTYYACLIEFEREAADDLRSGAAYSVEDDSLGIHLSLTVRSVFEQHLFHPFITLQNNRLVVIAFDYLPGKPAKSRLQQTFAALRLLKTGEPWKLTISVGRPGKGFLQAYHSYQEAIQALSLTSTLRKDVLFYDDIGVFQLLFNITDRGLLETFVYGSLGPVIEHDRTKGSELLRTLKVYLDHDGSKQETAGRLFIVRQSLYYRLDQIGSLLGPDYMEPEKRLSLQVAIRAYQLLHPDKEL
ncbi:PucR family transcriptional regulator [Paenibacillus ferrarius]|uniref:PucR family transcriptional regulator n=1 Tax=Paenibacillus ferrarius TaxID=1469647 RepID=UPI003D2DEB13